MVRDSRCTLAILAAALLAIAAGPAAGGEAPEQPGRPTTRIEKLYFMFHPVCWSMGMRGDQPPPLSPGISRKDYLACYRWEQKVNKRQKAFISRLKPNDVLILFPISRHPAMLELERHAVGVLGRRCIIIRRGGVDPPAEWAKLKKPIERFLNDDKLEGKAEFLEQVPPKIRDELAAEIRDACRTRGFDWDIRALEVIYTSRLYAMDIQAQFTKRGLTYDRRTLSSEAFGEGFEECAMNWKAMVVPYLGLARPADNIFDLSVSGGRFLVTARFKERVRINDDTRLYLWEGQDGRPIGFFARSWCRLKDPQYFAQLPLKGMKYEVWTQAKYGTRLWPAEDSPLKMNGSDLEVPVFNGIRRDAADIPSYVIGQGVTFAEFRRVLVNVAIRSDMEDRDPILLAHRGVVRHAPENTLPAFETAVALGVSIELDVYQTRDGQLVVIHDGSVDRTTNGSGEVTKMSLAEIRRLDAGSWFHPRFAGLKVPTLEEVFRLIHDRQRRPVTIALNMKVISPGIEAKIVKLVEKYDLFEQLFAFGQPADSSRRFKKASPRLRTTVVKIYDSKQFADALKNPLADCLWVGFVPGRDEMDRARRLGRQVWLSLYISGNRPDIWDKARASGMTGVCTDWPLECRLHWRRAAGKN